MNMQNPLHKTLLDEFWEGIPSFHATLFYESNMISKCKSYYSLTCQLLDVLKKICPLKKVFSAEDVDFSHRCQQIFLSLDTIPKEHYTKILLPLHRTKEEDLLKTLEVYLLDCDCSIKKTSKLLYIHRNTVLYRLHKIELLLNKEITKMPFYYELYTALALHRLSQ